MNKVSSILVALGITIAPLSISAEASSVREFSRILEDLNLTDQQLVAIRQLRAQHEQRIQPLRQQIQQRQQEIQTMLASSANTSELRAKHNQISTLRQEISQLRFEHALALRDILTPEQRQRLSQLNQRRPRRRDRI